MDPRGVWGRGGAGPGLAHLPGNNAQTTVCVTQWQRAGVLSASSPCLRVARSPPSRAARPGWGRGRGGDGARDLVWSWWPEPGKEA